MREAPLYREPQASRPRERCCLILPAKSRDRAERPCPSVALTLSQTLSHTLSHTHSLTRTPLTLTPCGPENAVARSCLSGHVTKMEDSCLPFRSLPACHPCRAPAARLGRATMSRVGQASGLRPQASTLRPQPSALSLKPLGRRLPSARSGVSPSRPLSLPPSLPPSFPPSLLQSSTPSRKSAGFSRGSVGGALDRRAPPQDPAQESRDRTGEILRGAGHCRRLPGLVFRV